MFYRNWRELIKPKRLILETDSENRFYGKFLCEPLERGFGLTLGNALRRILLSSLQGVAITSVKIDNVLHEFTAVPGVKEDVTDIILNLKEVRFRLQDTTSKLVTIKKQGEGVVTAGDIKGDSSVEILNPDKVICTLTTNDVDFMADMTVKMGKGYVPSELHEQDELPVGTIPIDSNFSPIERVAYNVTTARVGQVTDYDKLILEVWTDGSVMPVDAIAYAANILKDQLSIFINFEEEIIEEVKEEEDKKPSYYDNLFRTVDELELSVRSSNCLKNSNIRYIGELVQKSESEMLRTKNFGRKSLLEIKEILIGMGLSLGMKIDDWPPDEFKEAIERGENILEDSETF